MPLTLEEQLFMEDCVSRIKANNLSIDCLSDDDKQRLLVLLDKAAAEIYIPGSTYGRG